MASNQSPEPEREARPGFGKRMAYRVDRAGAREVESLIELLVGMAGALIFIFKTPLLIHRERKRRAAEREREAAENLEPNGEIT